MSAVRFGRVLVENLLSSTWHRNDLSLLIWETYNNKVTEDWTCGFQLNASAQPILLCTCGSSKMANLVEKIRTQYGLLFNNRIYLNGRLWRFHWNAGKSPNKKIKKKNHWHFSSGYIYWDFQSNCKSAIKPACNLFLLELWLSHRSVNIA